MGVMSRVGVMDSLFEKKSKEYHVAMSLKGYIVHVRDMSHSVHAEADELIRKVVPRFVKEIRYHGEVIKTFKTEVLNPSICSKQTIKKAVEMLEGVVENGTAKNLNNTVYKITHFFYTN